MKLRHSIFYPSKGLFQIKANNNFFHPFIYLAMSVSFFGCNSFQAAKQKKCWNDIDFKKTEKLLRTLPVKNSIPLREHLNLPERPFTPYERPAFVLILDKNIKAVFKTRCGELPLNCGSELMAYRFSQLMKFKLVPPTVIRTINGKKGTVRLFVDGVTGQDYNSVKYLTSEQKSDIYTFYFVLGENDAGEKHIILGRNCKKPALIDNDTMITVRAIFKYGDFPFFSYKIKNLEVLSLDHPKKWHGFPFDKVKFLKFNRPFKESTLKKIFPNMKETFLFILKTFHSDTLNNELHFVKWKNAYWIKLNLIDRKHIFKDFLPTVFSQRTIKQLEKIKVSDLSVPFYNKDIPKWYFSGFIHRKNIILKEAQKLRKASKKF